MFGVSWLSYWVFPFFAGLVWLSMLLALLLDWITAGSPHYPSFNPGQRIAYISDVGAQHLKPLFIAMSAVTVVTLDLALVFERWLRHSGRLTANTSRWQKILSILSILAAIVGAAGLILLSIFDTLRHPRLHDGFLVLFIGGYMVSAVFVCWEYQRLGIHFRQHRILRISFWMKLAFIFVELALAIVFGVLGNQAHYNGAAITEWIIALVFTLYVWSFAVDFIPALHSRMPKYGLGEHTDQIGMAEQEAANDSTAAVIQPGGRYYASPPTSGYGNGYANGYADEHQYKPAQPFGGAQPSSNF